MLSLKYRRQDEALSHFPRAAGAAGDKAGAFESPGMAALSFQNLSRWQRAGEDRKGGE